MNICRVALFLAITGIFSAISVTVTSAQTIGDVGVVNSSDGELNVRSGPATSFKILEVLKNGDKVGVLEVNKKWARVSLPSQKAGWVYMPLLAFQDNRSDLKFDVGDGALICNSGTDITNVRAGPSAKDFPVIAKLKNGHRVSVLNAQKNKGGFYYYRIGFQRPNSSQRLTGYVYFKALKSTCNGVSAVKSKPALKPAVTVSNSDNDIAYIKFGGYSSSSTLYKNTDSKSSRVASLSVGSKVGVLARTEDGWAKVKSTDGKIGWLRKYRLSDTPTKIGLRKVLGESNLEVIPVWKRKEAKGQSIAELKVGSKVDVIGISKGIWAMVQVSPTKTGWVYARYLEKAKVEEKPIVVSKPTAPKKTETTAKVADGPMVPKGTCELVVKTVLNLEKAVKYARGIDYANDWSSIKLFEEKFGTIAISVGNVRKEEATAALRELILGGVAPQDTKCKTDFGALDDRDPWTNYFVAVYDGNGKPTGANKKNFTFQTKPNQCYFVVASRKNTYEVSKFIDAQSSFKMNEFEIFKSESGWYAITLGTVKESDFESLKSRWNVPKDSYCSNGKAYVENRTGLCGRPAFECSSGYKVAYDSCNAMVAVSVMDDISLENGHSGGMQNAFCSMPDKFPRERLSVTGYNGYDKAKENYVFEAASASKKFTVHVNPKTNFVNFKWREPAKRTASKPKNKSKFTDKLSQKKYSYCWGIDNKDARHACLEEPWLTDNEDARKVLLGDCYGMSRRAQDYGLMQICAYPGKSSCSSIKNSDVSYACYSCNGSRRWVATAAAGHIFECLN